MEILQGIAGAVGAAIAWLNHNEGTAQVVGAILAVTLPGAGWLAIAALRSARQPGPRKDGANAPRLHSALDEIQATKTLRVALLDYPPLMTFAIVDNGIEGRGIYPRMLERVAKNEALSISWSRVNWSDITAVLDQGKVDLVASIFWTALRSEHAAFCGMMHRIGVTAVIRSEETRISTHEDLKRVDIRIEVVRGEIGWEYAVKVLGLEFEPKRLKVRDQIDIASAAEMVEDGTVDVFLADALSCWHACHKDGILSNKIKQIFCSDALYVCDNGFMIKRDDDRLREWLDVWVRRLSGQTRS